MGSRPPRARARMLGPVCFTPSHSALRPTPRHAASGLAPLRNETIPAATDSPLTSAEPNPIINRILAAGPPRSTDISRCDRTTPNCQTEPIPTTRDAAPNPPETEALSHLLTFSPSHLPTSSPRAQPGSLRITPTPCQSPPRLTEAHRGSARLSEAHTTKRPARPPPTQRCDDRHHKQPRNRPARPCNHGTGLSHLRPGPGS